MRLKSDDGRLKVALFGADHLRGDGRPILLLEGEFDLILAWQEGLTDFVDLGTFGGAEQPVPGRWLPYLLPSPVIFEAYDTDAAGRVGASKLAEITNRLRSAPVPEGSDLTDFHQAGGDLRAWMRYHLDRAEIRQAQTTNKAKAATPAPTWPKTFIIPAEKAQQPGLAVPKTWRWLDGGALEVTYADALEMQTCLDVTAHLQAG
jgi:hypothetical protein